MLATINAIDRNDTKSALQFMTHPTQLSAVRDRGARIRVNHGVSDADAFARLYRVPGMGHCSGGPETDPFDMLSALLDWVEQGIAPDRVTALARGAGNAGAVNGELPAGCAAKRTRLLCPGRWRRVTTAAAAWTRRRASAAAPDQ
jgi:feruloyl esterase